MSFPEPAWTVPVKQEPEDLLATGTVSVKPEPEDTGTVSVKLEPEDTGTVSIKPEPEDTGTVSIKPEPEDTGTVSIKPEPADETVSVKPEPEDVPDTGIGNTVRARRKGGRGKQKNYSENEIEDEVLLNGAERKNKKSYSENEIEVLLNGAERKKKKIYSENEIEVLLRGAERKKKKNYSENEIQVLLNGVERKKSIVFETVASGVHNLDKASAWKEITNNVNAVSATQRSVTEVKKKWSDLKMEVKKRMERRRSCRTAVGEGQDSGVGTPSPMDERICGIIGKVAISGVPSAEGLDTDAMQAETSSDDALHVCKEEVSPQQQERSPGLVQTESSVTEDSDEWMETREDPESEASDEEEEMETGSRCARFESSDAEDKAVGPTDPPEWRDKRSWNPKDIPFSGVPGPRGSAAALQSDNPVDYAELFLCDELLQHIVDHTNLYFSNDWRPLTLVELKNFLGLMFLTGLVWKPSLKDYWTQEEATSTPYFSRTMARDRYQLIWSSLHFNDNPQIDAGDRLHKIRPVLDLLLAKFKEMYQPAENVSIDEGMLFWSGRLGFRVYNPAKELQLGLKSYILTESATGYCYAMKPYIGPNCHLQDTVESLIDGLKGYGYRLWMDNFYTSVEMCRLLLGHQMHCCGTLRVHRGEPPAIRDVSVSDLAVGETVSRHNGDVMVLAWRDKRIVRMITTLHKDEMKRVKVKQKGHSGRVPQHKPACVLAYNLYMNGADRLDQKIAYFPWIGENEKWSFKFVAYMFQIALANAFIVYRAKNRGGRPRTLKRFILALVKSWTRLRPAGVDEANGPNPPDAPPVPEPPVPPSNRDNEKRLDVNFAGHLMVPVQPAVKQTKPLRLCKHCSNHNIQKETQYVCTGCDNVALCVYPCFFQYHTR